MTSVSAGHIILTPTQPVDFSTAVSTCVLETCGDRLAILRRDPVLVIKLGGHHYGNMNNHVPDVSTRNLYPGGSDLSHLSILKFFYVTCQTLCLRAGSWRRSTKEDPFFEAFDVTVEGHSTLSSDKFCSLYPFFTLSFCSF